MSALAPGTRLSDPERALITGVLRRVPEQSRSWRQVERVVAAAQALLDAEGYEEVASNPARLIESAGIPSGSFYTYFSNTEAVLDSLRLLWVERFQPMLARAFTVPCRTWSDPVDRAIDAVIEFFSYPSTRQLWLTYQLSSTALAAERASDAGMGDRVVREIDAIGFRFVGDDVDRVVMVAIFDQLVRLAFLRGRDGRPDPDYIDRARRATRAFVGPLVVQFPQPRPSIDPGEET